MVSTVTFVHLSLLRYLNSICLTLVVEACLTGSQLTGGGGGGSQLTGGGSGGSQLTGGGSGGSQLTGANGSSQLTGGGSQLKQASSLHDRLNNEEPDDIYAEIYIPSSEVSHYVGF